MTSNNLAIFTYTRAQAIADGVLIDVSSKLAREAGFRYPVALTAGVWAECVAVPEGVTGQDETGRLWDILTMLRFAIARQKGDTRTDRFRAPCPQRQPRRRPAARFALCPVWPGRQRRAGHYRNAAA